jgi:hypothetical protein
VTTIPPCAGKWSLFDSTEPRNHAKARALCAACPVILECYERLQLSLQVDTSARPRGTWAGMLIGRAAESVVDRRERIAREDAIYSEREALDAHNAYSRGERGAWAITGHRVWDRRYRRRRNQQEAAA